MSFKHGTGGHDRNGRLFLDLDEEEFDELIQKHSEFNVIRCWQSSDLRPDKENEKWLNVLVRKAGPTKRMKFLGVGQTPTSQ